MLRVFLVALALLVSAVRVEAQHIEHLEFSNAPVADILIALGRAAGRSIVPDETVDGTASYYFHDMDFASALSAFAARFDLFVEESEGIYTVSSLRVDRVAGPSGEPHFAVEAPEVSVAAFVAHLSRAARTPILFERTPEQKVGFYTDGSPLARILNQLSARLPHHRLEERDGAFLFAWVDDGETPPDKDWITRTEDRYSARLPHVGLADALALLFETGEREYQLLIDHPARVGPLSFTDKAFDELLVLILDHADAAHALVDDVYYVTETSPQSTRARTVVTRAVRLDHLSLSSLTELLPPEQVAGVTLRPDRVTGVVTLTGHERDVNRVLSLIRSLDAPPAGRTYHRFTLRAITPAALAAILPDHLSGLAITPLSGSTDFVTLASARQASELTEYLSRVDVPERSTLVVLDHIRVDQLLAHLPASARAAQLLPTGDPRRFFFLGNEDARARFLRDLEEIDVPRPQIRYQLLVIEYQEGHGLEFDLDLSSSLTTPDVTQAFLGTIGNLLSLNFDIVSTFGYQFAARLNANLANATAAVVADTTLSALSGEEVSFRNTNTYRYRDTVVDHETGEQETTGVIREITSGLMIDITGEASSGTVTMEVAATVSRRGTDGNATGNPPPTSEKVVRTQVRAAAGTPIILSGLRRREDEETVQETPILGRIPLLGWFFQGRRTTNDTTELAIYIVPRIDEGPKRQRGTAAELMKIYRHNFGETP